MLRGVPERVPAARGAPGQTGRDGPLCLAGLAAVACFRWFARPMFGYANSYWPVSGPKHITNMQLAGVMHQYSYYGCPQEVYIEWPYPVDPLSVEQNKMPPH